MLLANAPIPVSSNSNIELILIGTGVILITAILAFVPIQLARRTDHPQRDAVTALIVLWGLLLAGCVCYSVMRQMDWSTTHEQEIESGYLDPRDVSDQPRPPLTLWAGLAVGYAGITIWATRRK